MDVVQYIAVQVVESGMQVSVATTAPNIQDRSNGYYGNVTAAAETCSERQVIVIRRISEYIIEY